MSISVMWENNERTILRYRFNGKWTWEEFYAAIERGQALQDEVTQPVDVLLDMLESPVVPGGAIRHFRPIGKIAHPNTEMRIVVSSSGIIAGLYAVFIRMIGSAARSYRIVRTLDEAHTLITDLQAQRQPDPQ